MNRLNIDEYTLSVAKSELFILVIFTEFKKEVLRISSSRMTKKDWLINIREKDNFICHSVAGEESHVFLNFSPDV